ncbi:MAG: hypothetical protein P8X67_14020 [Syntrophobacterales bacterium]
MIAVRVFLIALAITVSGCAHHQTLPPEKVHTIYLADGEEGEVLNRYAPVFLTYDYQREYNHIGRPAARFDEKGEALVYVDATKPVIFYLEQEFSTERGNYTNLVYRIHFPKVPFSIIPFYLTSGNNVGVIVVITLDSQQRPVLVTTVGTCGCYAAIVPTTYLPRDDFPEEWKDRPLDVYGEQLPLLAPAAAMLQSSLQPTYPGMISPGIGKIGLWMFMGSNCLLFWTTTKKNTRSCLYI